jgi:hypothetical protein
VQGQGAQPSIALVTEIPTQGRVFVNRGLLPQEGNLGRLCRFDTGDEGGFTKHRQYPRKHVQWNGEQD